MPLAPVPRRAFARALRRRALVVVAGVTVAGASAMSGADARAQAVPNGGSARPAAPDSPGARRLGELVRAINSGNADTIRRFVDAAMSASSRARISPAERTDQLYGVYARSGGYTVRGPIEQSSPTEVRALVQSKRTEEWLRLLVMVDAAEPTAIDRIGLQPAPDPDLPARRLSDAEVVARLRAYVEKLARSDDFSGTVMLARDGRPLYTAAYGQANRDFAVPNRLDTKFNLGSMNKMFTAVSIAQLAEAGKLSFDDSLGKFLPAGAMRPEVLAKVRIKHLLTHTSGLGSYFTPEWDAQSRARYRTVDDWMALVKNDSLRFEPGTRWEYSNTGMLVLGKVIEAASGEDYFTYVREHVYEPAGMTSSDSYDLDRVNPNLAVGYDKTVTPKGVEWRNNIFAHVIRGGPAGGGYSTVADLTRFATALRSGKLVGRKYVELLTTAKPELASPGYGYGFAVDEGGRVVGHSGGFTGISSNLDIFDDGYTAAVMSNYSGGAQPIQAKARGLLLAGKQKATASR